MSAQELRVEMLGLLAEIRSAGRGASHSALSAILDARLPGLVSSGDEFAEARLNEVTKERLKSAVSAACAEARESGTAAQSGLVPGVAGRRRQEAEVTARRERRSWVWGLAGAAVLLLLGFVLFSLLAPEKQIVAPKDRPGITGPEPTIPPPPSPRPDGQVAEKGPDTVIESRPVPRLRERERVVAEEQPVVGEFTNVMGEPVLVAAGTRPIPAQPGMKIAQGSRIETGDMDKAEIRLGDGSVITLDFNTTLTVRADPEGRLLAARDFDLTSGRIMAKVVHTPDDDRFTVRTPVATAEVLGTEFFLGLEKIRTSTPAPEGTPPLKAVLQVKEGHVAFYNDFGRVVAPENTETTATQVSAPTEPKRLPVLRTFRLNPLYSWAISTKRLAEATARDMLLCPMGHLGMDHQWLPEGNVLVTGLQGLGPAQQAGIGVGDQIASVDGQPLHSDRQFHAAACRDPGKTVHLQILRDGRLIAFQVRTAQVKGAGPAIPATIARRIRNCIDLANAGDINSAIGRLRAVTEEFPHPLAFSNLGVLYETKDDMQHAIRSYHTAVKGAPRFWLYHLYLGQVLEKIGNVERAREEFELAALLEPNKPILRAKLARALAVLGRFDEALAVTEKGLSKFPNSVELWGSKAETLLYMRRHEEALRAAQTAVALGPDNPDALQNLAEAYHQLRKLDDAIATLKRMSSLRPSDAFVHNNLAILLEEAGRLDEAEAAYRRAIAFEPKYAQAHGHLGDLLRGAGRLKDAEQMLRKALSLDPDTVVSLVGLAKVFEQTGRLKEAEDMFRRSLRLDPTSASAHVAFADFLRATKRLEAAEISLRRAIELEPGYAEPYNNLGLLLRDTGRIREAEVMYRKAIDLDPVTPAPYTNLGNLLRERGELREAETMLRKAVELAPGSPEVHNNLGALFFDANRYEDAEAMYRKAIALDSAYPYPYNNLGNVLRAMDRRQEAEAMYRKAIVLDAGYFEAHYNLGSLLRVAGRLQESETNYRRAYELEPEYLGDRNRVVLRNMLAWLCYGNGKKREAIRLYRESLKIDPNNTNTLTGIVWGLMELEEDLEEALSLAQRCVNLSPDDMNAVSNVGWVYYKLGDMAKAEAHLTKSLHGTKFGEQPDTAETWWALGMVYEKAGRKDRAIDAQKKALSLDPKLEKAREALARLGG